MAIQILDEDDVRRIAREEAQRPEFVQQRTVKAVIGVEHRDYLRDANAGKFPTRKHHRLIIAKTVDVIDYYANDGRPKAKIAVAHDADAQTIALAKVGARRVG